MLAQDDPPVRRRPSQFPWDCVVFCFCALSAWRALAASEFCTEVVQAPVAPVHASVAESLHVKAVFKLSVSRPLIRSDVCPLFSSSILRNSWILCLVSRRNSPLPTRATIYGLPISCCDQIHFFSSETTVCPVERTSVCLVALSSTILELMVDC